MLLKVRVVPNARKPRVEETENGLKVWVDAPAVEGRANRRLIEILAKHFRIKKGALTVVKGEKGREKIIEIVDDVISRQ